MDSQDDDAASSCPAWCRTPSEEHAADDPGARVHEGPRFGVVRTWWSEGPGGGFCASLDDEAVGLGGDLDVDDLRELAGAALDAAIWLDRQSRHGAPSAGRSVVDLVREAHQRAHRTA